MTIQVNPIVSPRIITVPEADGTEITIQSLVNQIRDWEDNQANLSYDHLLFASGKDDLGGGVLVGITARLINAKLKFEARASPTTCTVTGGNLVAVDANGNSMYPLEYSDNVMATITASSSATLQEQTDIQYGSFQNEVAIDVTNGVSGVSFPTGTSRQPSSNLTDAKLIAEERGFDTLRVKGELTIKGSEISPLPVESISGYGIHGEGSTFNVARTKIILNTGCTTANTFYEDLWVEGRQGGESTYHNCIIGELENAHCHYEYCGLLGPIQISNTGGFLLTHNASLNYCYTTHEWCEIDYNNSPMNMTLSELSGRIKFSNIVNANADLIIRLAAGVVWLDSTCTAGNVKVNGVGEIINESQGTMVNTEGLVTGRKRGIFK